MMPGMGDLRALMSKRSDFWINPKNMSMIGRRMQQLYESGALPNIPYGQVRRVATTNFPSTIGVREFARAHGIENLLSYDPRTKQVYLGGFEVPYDFGLGGRTYADKSRLEAIYKRLLAQTIR